MAATDTERLAVLIEANTKSYERAMARIEGRTNQTMARASRSVKTLDAQMKATALTATRFMGVFGVTLGIGGISQLIGQLDELGKQARIIGVTAEQFQALQHGFKLAGVEAGLFARSMEEFATRLGVAATRGNELGKVFEANGIALRDADGNMRSVMDRLLDYAELIKNAADETQALALADIAFGRAGGAMARGLREGRIGIEEMMTAARNAGVIFDEELIDKAAEFNDAWDTAWRKFRVMAVNNIFPVGKMLTDVVAQAMDFVRMLNAVKNLDLERAMQLFADRFGKPLEVTIEEPRGGPATVIPGKAEKVSTKGRIDREREAVERLLESHRLELAVLRELDPIQKEMIGHRETLAAATGAERQELETLIRTMRALEEAQLLAAERMQVFQQAAFGALDGLIIRGQKATDVMRDLLTQIARMALHSAIFGGGLFGGGGLGSLFPKRALGGPVTAGRPYMVGERGPELFIPKASGQIVANDNIGGVTVAPVYQIDARGSDISESRFRAILEQNSQQLRSQVVPMIREAQSRRVL